MYKYIIMIKEKQRGVTNEFQVNLENRMLRNACKMHMQILLYYIAAASLQSIY
jgi:hypothetical protein